MRVNVTWKKNCPFSVLGGSFLEKTYQLFVGTLETVSYPGVRTFQLFLDICNPLDMCEYIVKAELNFFTNIKLI